MNALSDARMRGIQLRLETREEQMVRRLRRQLRTKSLDRWFNPLCRLALCIGAAVAILIGGD